MRAVLSSLAVVLLAVCCAFAFSLAEARANVDYNEVLTGEFPWYARLFTFPLRLFAPSTLFVVALFPFGGFFLGHLAGKLASIVAALALLAWGFWPNPFAQYPPMEARLRGQIDRAQHLELIPKLEEWALKMGEHREVYVGSNFKADELPIFFKDLSVSRIGLPDVFVGPQFNYTEPVIAISFGGGFGGWSLIVGFDKELTNSTARRRLRVSNQIVGTFY